MADAGHPESVTGQLERILSKPPLATSPSLSRLLRFIVAETLAGHAESINEYTLGVRVFNRGEDFNPRTDPIVRVQAHHLRARLGQYYAGPGVTDAVRIELPGRTYVPVFRSVEQPAPAPVEAPQETAPAANPEQAPRTKMRGTVMVTAVVGFIALAGMASFWHSFAANRGARLQHQPPAAAEDLYIHGRYLIDRQTEPALRQSLDCFHRAVAKDPQFAAAFAGLADAYNMLAQYGYMSPLEAMEEARRATEHALSMDPRLAEAHVSLAAILEAYDWNWSAAEREYRRALELNPTLPDAHLWYGMFLRDQGRIQEALPELRRAEQLEPLSVLASINVAYGLMIAGDSDGALERAQRAVDLNPDLATSSALLANVYRKLSDAPRAEAALAHALALSAGNPHALSVLACTYARLGNRPEGTRLFHELEKLSTERYVSPYDMGNVSLVLGDEDRAVNFFEDAYKQRSSGLIFLRNDKADSVLNSPRLRSLISRIHVG